MNRLDSFLLSEDQRISTWQISAQWVGARDISDHCPTCLACLVVDWGPKPFRFNNCWLEHKDFNSFVEESCRNFNVGGWKLCMLLRRN